MKYFPVLILLALPARIAHAQNAVLATLPSDMQRFVVEADPTLVYRTENVPGGRWDLDAGVMRAVFRLPPTSEVATTHEGTARAWMDAEADRFGWSSSDEFELQRTIEGRYSAHLSFRQVFRGVKVLNRIVKVNLSADGHPTMVFSGYAPHLREFADFNPAPAVGAGEAENLAKRAVHDGPVRATPAELVVYPAKVPRLAWRVVTWPEGVPLSWEVLLDARTGEIIYLFQLLLHGHLFKDFPKPAAEPYHEPSHSPVGFVDGTGLVFDPDPLTTAGVEYGAPYVDSNDEDVPELNDERLEVDLLDITESDDGLYRLEGPYVKITGDPALGGTSWTPPAIADADSFLYGRADQFFEAVNVYYHIDKSQRYIQSLDIGHKVQERPLRAHPHGFGGLANASYDPTLNAIIFGDGGIDTAEDAHVIWHEYGHAILEDITPHSLSTFGFSAIHEGFGDYWAVSYTRGLIDDGTVPDRDWKKVGTWAGNDTWSGRYLNHDGHYPEDITCGYGGSCNIYEDGVFWATSMMDLWGELGGELLDRLILASHAYYSNYVTMPNTAETVVQADNDLYGGVHVGTITRVLGNRGLLDASQAPPTVTHEPLTTIEDLSLGATFTVTAVSNGPPVESVSAHYSINEGPLVEIELADGGDDTYDATVSLPADIQLLEYYVEAVATAGPSVLLPVGAPDSLYRVGIEYILRLSHEPLGWVETRGAAVVFRVDVDAPGQSVTEVRLHWRPDAEEFAAVSLEEEEAGSYAASVELPEDASAVEYWFEASTDAGVLARLPENAPDAAFRFPVGPVPSLSHEWPVAYPGETATLRVDAVAGSAPVRGVAVHYGFDGGVTNYEDLEAEGGDAWAATVPLGEDALEIFYWFEAEAENDLTARLPIDAPETVFEVPVGAAPALSHDTLGWEPEPGADVAFSVAVESADADIYEVLLHWRTGTGTFTSVGLSSEGDGAYGASLTLPADAYDIAYWFEATAFNGLSSRLPALAPSVVFRFPVGPLPAISHEEVGPVSNADDPVSFVAEIAAPHAPLAETELLHRINGSDWTSSAMAAENDSLYAVTVTLSDEAYKVDYWFRAELSNGLEAKLPEGAPDSVFSFVVGGVPAIAHEPLGWEQDPEASIGFTAEVDGNGAEIASVTLRYAYDPGAWDSLAFEPSGGGYGAILDLPGDALEVDYYVEAVSEYGFTTRLPESAPDSTFRFPVGPVPAISHEELGPVPDADDPIHFVAEIEAPHAPVAETELRHRINGGDWITSDMAAENDSLYAVTVTLSDEAAKVEYWFRAELTNGLSAKRPEDAPDSVFSFAVGGVPEIAHEPLGWEQDPDASIGFTAEVDGNGAEIASVTLRYAYNQGAWDSLAFEPSGGGYGATLGLPGDAVEVDYYMEAVSEYGFTTRLPELAPDSTFRFPVGPAPAISHEELGPVPDADDPVPFIAEIEAPHAPVAEAELLHRINGGDWIPSDMAAENDSLYAVTVTLPDEADKVDYWFRAELTNGLSAKRPEGAPDSVFSFRVGGVPAIAHEPLGWEQDPDASIGFTAEVDGNGAEIARVTLRYAYDQGAWDSLAFEPSGGGYGATLGLPGDAVEVDYYVEAVSEYGFTTRLPELAPDSTFRFPVGPAPAIVHQPQAWVPTFGAPLTLSATVTAPHAPVAEALLHYRKEGSAYDVLPMAQNADSEWEATITLDAVSVEYWLQASATNALEARSPESAPDDVHSFPVGARPSLAHDQLGRVETVGATVEFAADVTSPDVPVAEVLLTYRLNGGPWRDKALALKAGIAYAASVVLPDDAEIVEYRFEATTTNGLSARLPEEGNSFSFLVGADVIAPDVSHDPILLIAVKDWPPGVSAVATDDYGIESVWVEYTVTGTGGATIKEGSIPLNPEGNRYGGTFPAVELPERSTVAYRVLARDIALDPNVGALPPEGEARFTFPATVEGEAIAYDFESPDSFSATGSWERGAPTYGLTVARSGRSVWGTALDGAVAASASMSQLRLPAVLLPSDHGALLEFWHWYDFEHAGVTGPGHSTDGTIHDGANVKASVDGGLTWALLTPERGYTGRIASGAGNPLEGQDAFGGYGFGWRRVRAALPAERAVLVRFDMGTNRGNGHESRCHAGWMIDDVRVLTAPMTDDQPPEVLRAPAAVLESAADEELQPITLAARDNVGVESVTADWEHTSDIRSRTGTLRLDMAASDASTFTGTIPTAGPPASGDRITYTLRLQDFDGNETVLPESGDPFAIEVRLRRSVGALRGATVTGLWASDGDGYAARGTGGNALSSVVLQPQDLASNTDQIVLELAHAFELGAGTGGNLKLSSDGGAMWTVLDPLEGYGAAFETQNAHPMRGEPVFAGSAADSAVATFDLGAYRALQVRLRLDLGAERVLSPAEFWTVSDLTLVATTSENELEVPRELSLHANFPDPFSESTTIGFTLPDAASVRIEAYDILGRRVRVLVDREFEAGTHSLAMPRGGLAAGVYFLRMRADAVHLLERMVAVR